jgi:hypothetical protein
MRELYVQVEFGQFFLGYVRFGLRITLLRFRFGVYRHPPARSSCGGSYSISLVWVGLDWAGIGKVKSGWCTGPLRIHLNVRIAWFTSVSLTLLFFKQAVIDVDTLKVKDHSLPTISM